MKTNPCTDCVENVKGLCLVEAQRVEDILRPDECKSYSTAPLTAIRAEVVKWRDAVKAGYGNASGTFTEGKIEAYSMVLDLLDGEV